MLTPHQAALAAAHTLLVDLIKTDTLPVTDSVTVDDEGWSVTVVIRPTGTSHRTPCERDILSVLLTATGRMSGSKILAELERRGLLHGGSTVGHTLADMVKRGLITASRKSPRGYAVADVPDRSAG